MKKIISLLLVSAIILSILPVAVYGKTVLARADFENFEIGETDISNRYVKIGGTSGVYTTVAKSPVGGTKAVRIENNGPDAGASTSANVTLEANSKGKITLSFKYMMTAFHPAASVKVYDTVSRLNRSVLNILSGNIIPLTGENNTQLMEFAQPIDANKWFKIKLVVDTEAGLYDFWLNDELAAEKIEVPLKEELKANGITNFIIQRQSGKTETATSYIDDITVIKGDEESETEPDIWVEEDFGQELRFSPRDKQIMIQNPPYFNWPAIALADGYRLQLARNEAMDNPEYDIENIEKNFYLFSHTLEPGVWYYRVKATNMNGETEWSKTKRFRIREDATVLPVPDSYELMESMPDEHPRIWVNSSNIEEFRANKESGDAKEFYENLKAKVDKELSNPLPEDPDDFMVWDPNASADDKNNLKTDLRNYSDGKCKEMLDAAYMYLITGEDKYGKKAAAFAGKIASWNPYGMTQYNIQDQVFEYISYTTALTFDWVYHFISPADKKVILEMLEYRIGYMYSLFMRDYPLWELPYDSHKSSQAQKRLIESMILLHELPEAKKWFTELFPVCVGVLPPWGGQDGGYSGGTAYASYGQTVTFGMALDAIETATGFKVFDKPGERNRRDYFMYFSGSGSPFGSFGDEIYNVSWVDSTVTNAHLMYASRYNDPYAKWAAETRGVMPYAEELVTYKYFNDVEAIPPFTEMNSYYDRDIGWVMFLSDLTDPNRVGINFKASPYGAYNHTHADNNTFNIYAYGEPLAVDSGWYDYYNSDHHRYYTKQTVAHNGITVKGGKGQFYEVTNEAECMNRNGEILGYIPGDIFNITSGDSTKAYDEYFSKAKRHLIYLKPDYLVVVDELKTKNEEKLSMEYNLHFRSQPEVYVDDAETVTTQGRAKLVSNIRYPEIKDIMQIDRYLNINGEEQRPQTRHANKKNQYAVRFETEETDETVMVSTFDILKSEDAKKQVKEENNGRVMKITVEGKEVYIRLESEGGEVTFGDVTFEGVAAVVDGENYALINGTKLSKGGKTLVSSTSRGSFSHEGGEVHLSSDDGTVTMAVPTAVASVSDERGENIPSGSADEYDYQRHTFKWTYENGVLKVEKEYGTDNLYFNGTPVTKYEGTTVRINGTPVEYENKPYSVNGSLFVPLSETAKAYGAEYKEENGVHTVTRVSQLYNGYTHLGESTRVIELTEGSAEVKVNGEKKTMDYPTEMKNGCLYIPLRGYFELFTDRIGWSDYAKTAYVYSEPVYHDDYTNSIWPRVDIASEEELYEINNKVLSVFNSGKGTVEYNKVFAVGEAVSFTVTPEEGWYLSKVTFNGEELSGVREDGFECTIGIPHKLSVFYAYFSRIEDKKPSVSSYEEMAREGSDLYYFGKLEDLGKNVSEFGILLSEENSDPVPGESGTERIKAEYPVNKEGYFGFKITSSRLENG